jgi:hypothetical protein
MKWELMEMQNQLYYASNPSSGSTNNRDLVRDFLLYGSWLEMLRLLWLWYIVGTKTRGFENIKSSQIFIVWHTVTGGAIGSHITGKWIVSLCVRTDHPLQLLSTVFVNFQTLSTIINRPSSINGWLISGWSYQQLVDKKKSLTTIHRW